MDNSSTSTEAAPSTAECLQVIKFFDDLKYLYSDIRSLNLSNPKVCCDMEGVTCAEDKVVSIQLRNKGLHGQLPKSITGLKSLQVLDLSGNYLLGYIPSYIGELKQLKTL